MKRPWKVWVELGGKNWRCRWRGKYGQGQHVFVFQDDANDLAKARKAEFQRRDSGLPAIPKVQTITVSDWAAAYLKHRSSNPRQNTYRNFDKPALDQFVEFCNDPGSAWLVDHDLIGDTDLPSLALSCLDEWKEWLYAHKEYDHTTVRMRLAHLRPALKWAKKRGWVTSNIAEDIGLPPSGSPGRVLTESEIQTLYAIPGMPQNALLAFITLLNSGMRKAEVITLMESQVETVTAPAPWRVHFEPHQTKNGKPKSVILNEIAQAAVFKAMTASRTKQVFENLTEDIIDYWMRKAQDLLGEVRLHDLKHTFCTAWMRQTGDIHGLQQMTGNSFNSLRIYVHLGKDRPRGFTNFKGFAPSWPLNVPN